jgi:hypothetical protein
MLVPAAVAVTCPAERLVLADGMAPTPDRRPPWQGESPLKGRTTDTPAAARHGARQELVGGVVVLDTQAVRAASG